VQRDIRAVKLRQMSVRVVLCIDTGVNVNLISDVIQAHQYMVLAEIKGCQVRVWIVGNEVFKCHEFYTASVWVKAD